MRKIWRNLCLTQSVEVCRGLSSCRAVELDTLTPRHMQSGGVLSRSVEVCRELSSSCRAILSSYCQVTVEFPVELSRPGLNRTVGCDDQPALPGAARRPELRRARVGVSYE